MFRMVELTLCTKITPFFLVISEAHVFSATFWVVVWTIGPVVDSATTDPMGAFADFEVITDLVALIHFHTCKSS